MSPHPTTLSDLLQSVWKSLFALLIIQLAGRPIGPRELADLLAIDERTAIHHLRTLQSAGLLCRVQYRSGYAPTRLGLWLSGAAPHLVAALPDPHSPQTTFLLEEEAPIPAHTGEDHPEEIPAHSSFMPQDSDSLSPDSILLSSDSTFLPASTTAFNNLKDLIDLDLQDLIKAVAVVEPQPGENLRSPGLNLRSHPQNLRSEPSQKMTRFQEKIAALSPAAQENLQALRANGVGPNDRVIQLCQMDHVDPDYIDAQARRLRQEQRFSPRLLITILESADPVLEDVEADLQDRTSEEARQRYATSWLQFQ